MRFSDQMPLHFQDALPDRSAVVVIGAGIIGMATAWFLARHGIEALVLDKGRVRMRVWERGAAETLACGTGACATVVAGVLEGRIKRECVVELPGGPLEINWRADNDHVMMTGPGEKVYSGELTL